MPKIIFEKIPEKARAKFLEKKFSCRDLLSTDKLKPLILERKNQL
jgi:hypothetical protein